MSLIVREEDGWEMMGSKFGGFVSVFIQKENIALKTTIIQRRMKMR